MVHSKKKSSAAAIALLAFTSTVNATVSAAAASHHVVDESSSSSLEASASAATATSALELEDGDPREHEHYEHLQESMPSLRRPPPQPQQQHAGDAGERQWQPPHQHSPPPPPRELASSGSAPRCGGTSGTYLSTYFGCYDDAVKDRIFPHEPFARNRGHSPLDCERECSKSGYKYFGREFKGQCFCGNGEEFRQRAAARGGCDCCGANVGSGGAICIWEHGGNSGGSSSSNSDQSSVQRAAPAPRPPIPSPSPPPPPRTNNNHQHELVTLSNSGGGGASTKKPTGGFRIRLYWNPKYNWQNSKSEKFWCMECRGSCRNGEPIEINHCNGDKQQKFIAMGRTIRPESDVHLCVSESGYGGKRSPVKLKTCNGGKDQNWSELSAEGKFELQPQGNDGRCLSQHHHPKPKETVYPENCVKTRRFDTTYWVTY